MTSFEVFFQAREDVALYARNYKRTFLVSTTNIHTFTDNTFEDVKGDWELLIFVDFCFGGVPRLSMKLISTFRAF